MTRIARGYSALAPFYDALGAAAFAGALARSRRCFLNRVRHARRALLVGDGTGGFLVELLAAGFAGDVVYVDIAPGMLEAARRKVRRKFPATGGRIEYVCGDAERFEDAAGFDLVCTHYFLDGFGEDRLERVVVRIGRCLSEGGSWVVTDFTPPSGRWLRRVGQRGVQSGLYAFFRAACGIEARRLPSIDGALEREGLLPVARERFLGGWLESAIWVRPNRERSAFG